MSSKKRTPTKALKFNDFRAILDLPERLARYLRELLHLERSDWHFCVDKLRQHKAAQKRIDDELKAKTEKGNTKSSKSPERRPVAGIAYREWSKSKGRGKGRRYFAAPCDELKRIQGSILNRFLWAIPVHFCRRGNQIGSSIVSNAGWHRNFAKSVFSVDIVNAFPSVFRSRIKANLKMPFRFRLRQFAGVSFTEGDFEMMLDSLVDLLCFRDRLPQGPPTSPRLLDIVSHKLDCQMYELLQNNSTPFQQYRLTAYADDLTISTDGRIPEELREQILDVIRSNGFIPHVRKDKTEYFSPETGKVPVVTGLVLTTDGRLTMAPGKVNQLRARLHSLTRRKVWTSEVMGVVAGTLGYIGQIYPGKAPAKLRTPVANAVARLELEKRKALGISDPAAKAPPAKAKKKTARKRATTKKPTRSTTSSRKGKGGK